MFRVVVAALVAVFLCLPAAAVCVPMASLVEAYQAEGASILVVDKKGLASFLEGLSVVTGTDYSEATAAFIVETEAGIEVGVEADGCLLEPITLVIDTTPGKGA